MQFSIKLSELNFRSSTYFSYEPFLLTFEVEKCEFLAFYILRWHKVVSILMFIDKNEFCNLLN